MRRSSRVALLALLVVVAAQSAAAQTLLPPLPANTYIHVGGLDWAWASPCNNDCSSIVFVDSFRYATISEWAGRPAASAFLDPGGNFTGSGGRMRCAAAYFDVALTNCDYSDAASGAVTSGPGIPGGTYWETWLVRGESVAVTSTPEPASLALLATGLLGLVGHVRRRREH